MLINTKKKCHETSKKVNFENAFCIWIPKKVPKLCLQFQLFIVLFVCFASTISACAYHIISLIPPHNTHENPLFSCVVCLCIAFQLQFPFILHYPFPQQFAYFAHMRHNVIHLVHDFYYIAGQCCFCFVFALFLLCNCP